MQRSHSKIYKYEQQVIRENIYPDILQKLRPWEKQKLNQDNINLLFNIAANENNIRMMRLLIRVGVDPNLALTHYASALHQAAKQGNLDMASMLLEFEHTNKDLKNKLGYTPLSSAAYFGHLQCVSLLMARGADAEITTKKGETALYIATARGRLRIVNKLLHNKQVDINHPTHSGRTPLYIAAKKGHVKIVNHLLNAGANPFLADNKKKTPSDVAHVKTVYLLPHRKKQVDNVGIIPLMLAQGYDPTSILGGVCSGIADLGLCAIQTQEFDPASIYHFNTRMKLINDIFSDELLVKIFKTELKRHDLLRAAKKTFRTNQFSPKTEISKKIDEYVEKHLLFTEKRLLEIPIFNQAVDIAQNPELHNAWTSKKLVAGYQQTKFTLPFIMPVILEKQGGIVEIGHFSGIYTQKDLTISYFKTFIAHFDVAYPVSLRLTSRGHAITLGFINKEWGMISHNLMINYTSTKVAAAVVRAFSANDICSFETIGFVNKIHEQEAKAFFDNWRNTKSMQALHQVNAIKANLTDSDGAYWHDVTADIEGNVQLTQSLLIHGSFFKRYKDNKESKWDALYAGISLLLLAITENGLCLALFAIALLIAYQHGKKEDSKIIKSAQHQNKFLTWVDSTTASTNQFKRP